MRVKSGGVQPASVDLTPLIDVVFQLLAFFTFIMNFEASEQDDRVLLPTSILAKPPETALEAPIVVQVTSKDTILVGGQEYANAEAIRPVLSNEKYVLESQNRTANDATIVIRAHQRAKTGIVQNLIKVSQLVGFEKFSLRAQEDLQYEQR